MKHVLATSSSLTLSLQRAGRKNEAISTLILFHLYIFMQQARNKKFSRDSGKHSENSMFSAFTHEEKNVKLSPLQAVEAFGGERC
jgi:hypothetical protein